MGKHRGTDIETAVQPIGSPRAPCRDGRTFGDAGCDQRLDLVELSAGDDRTDVRVGGGIAGSNRGCHRVEAFAYFVHPVGGDEHPRRRIAGLPGVGDKRAKPGFSCGGDIGIGQDDIRRLTAEFLMNALDRRRGGAGDLDSGAGRSGERDHIDFGMGAQRGARFGSITVDQVEHTRRYAGGFEHLGPDLGRKRRQLRRLENHRATGGQRRSNFGGDLVDRPVPRGDQCTDPDRLADNPGITARFLERELLEDIERHLQVDVADPGMELLGQHAWGAHFLGDCSGEIAAALAILIDDRFEQIDSFAAGAARPCRKCAPRRHHRAVNIGRAGQADFTGWLFGRRVNHRESAGNRWVDPFAIDEELQCSPRHLQNPHPAPCL